MLKYVKEFVNSCAHCQRYKVLNTKPAGFLQTPAPTQRFEALAVDLSRKPRLITGYPAVVSLGSREPSYKMGRIIFYVHYMRPPCAKILIEEVFLRHGTPRKMISDNGVQFISDVMQKKTYCFGIDTPYIPLYHVSSNPVERKNRDLKTMLAILVQNEHFKWDDYIPSIRFALNATYTRLSLGIRLRCLSCRR